MSVDVFSNLVGIDPPFRGVYRMSSSFLLHFRPDPFAAGESLADQEVGNLSLRKGQRVFVDLAHASRDVSSSQLLRLSPLIGRQFSPIRSLARPQSSHIAGPVIGSWPGMESSARLVSSWR
jgi:hypothetical protein